MLPKSGAHRPLRGPAEVVDAAVPVAVLPVTDAAAGSRKLERLLPVRNAAGEKGGGGKIPAWGYDGDAPDNWGATPWVVGLYQSTTYYTTTHYSTTARRAVIPEPFGAEINGPVWVRCRTQTPCLRW